ncbi:MAG: hypothetical protein HYX46_13420 [Betaproteobacteria bacterium]|nr:hypothetical protein [Betaproteobacteria bacterium]
MTDADRSDDIGRHATLFTTVTSPLFATRGSQRWLQVAVARAPELLQEALRTSGALDYGETVDWKSPLGTENFCEYRDGAVLRCLGIDHLPNRKLSEFWPAGGPVWDALGTTSEGRHLLVEAKAHIAEAASPASQASEKSLEVIRSSLAEARRYYSPRSTAEWSGSLYQYANRLAFQYFFAKVNGLPSRLVFLNFCNAVDVSGPESEAEWHGATKLIHSLLGVPDDLRNRGVFHAFVDARKLTDIALQ